MRIAVGGGHKNLREMNTQIESELKFSLPLLAAVGLLGDLAGHDNDATLAHGHAVARIDVLVKIGSVGRKHGEKFRKIGETYLMNDCRSADASGAGNALDSSLRRVRVLSTVSGAGWIVSDWRIAKPISGAERRTRPRGAAGLERESPIKVGKFCWWN